MLTAHGVTHPGRVRSMNEDAWLSQIDLGLFVVADGMGGHNAGEVASSLAVDAIRLFVERTSQGDDLTWPFGVDPHLSFGANRVLTAMKLANQRVFKSSESLDERAGMGTTAVTALVESGRLIYAGVGDSRIYSWSEGRLLQLTADDSWVSDVVAQQTGVNPASLRHHPMRNVLTNAIGTRETLELTVYERALANGDVLLLCTDGLHTAVADAEVETILGSGAGVEVMAERLVAAALQGTASDNITALVLRYEP